MSCNLNRFIWKRWGDSGNLFALELEATDRTIEEEGKESCIEVDSLFVIEYEMKDGDEQRERRSFWSSVSLEELAEEQGVGVLSDIGSIAALWPADDDPDDLLDFVLHDRCERRKVAFEGNA